MKGALPPGTKGARPGRAKQVPGDGYSPPCIAFSGSNGGATAKGVTGDSIVISARITNDPGFQQALAQVAGAQITDTPDDVKRTLLALADYFNKRFQFYGRKIQIKFFDGKGSSTTELLGGGQEEAEADAVTAASEIKAFGEVNATTAPYHDALTRRKVMAFGAPYMSREWMGARQPYSWSIATDCSIVTESVAEFGNKKLARKPAIYAGDQYKNTTRKIALLAPENPWYQECVNAGVKIANAAGNPPADRIAYKLDLGSMSNQATNVVAKLKSEGITTVICGCDPVFPIFLTQKAQEQGYQPEWIVTGTAFTDQDLVGQLYDQTQWKHAFGISYLGSPQPLRASSGYFAYKAVRSDEPAFIVDIIYYQLYMLAIGLQMAGPNLTPQTFQQGMFAYPGRHGTGRHVGLRAGPLHAHPGLPRDLLGPDQDLAAEQQAGRLRRAPSGRAQQAGPAARRRPAGLHRLMAASPDGGVRLVAAVPRPLLYAAGAVVAWPVLATLLPRGAPVGVVLVGAVLGTVTALLAMGLILIYRTNRIINFAYGSMGGVAGVISVDLFITHHWNYYLASALSLVIGVAAGGLLEFLVIRRFANSSRLVLTVATIGLAQVLGGFELLIPRWMGSPPFFGSFPTPIHVNLTINPIIFKGSHLLIVASVPAVIAGLAWFLLRTDAGVAVRAAAENAERALLLGIPIRRLSTIVWMVAGGLATLTFILKAPFAGTASGALTGPSLLLPALATAVVARMESLPVAFGAGVGLGVLEQVVLWNYPPSAVDVAYLGVILVALLLRRDRLTRAQDIGASSWSDTGMVRAIPRELRRLPEVRIARASSSAWRWRRSWCSCRSASATTRATSTS